MLMAWRLVARPFTAEESRLRLAALDDLLRYYKTHPAEAKELVDGGRIEGRTRRSMFRCWPPGPCWPIS